MLSQPSDSESEHNYLGSIQPTLNDVLLALTLPPSALALSVWMPKRRRERILEVTKTVTVTELAHAHPKILRNRHHSVSNVEVGDGHPVTLHISQTTDQYEAAPSPKSEAQSEPLDFTYRNPLINCDDDEDVVETVHTVNEKFIQFPESMIVDVQSKVNKSHSGNNADNIIDISFDTSRTELNKTSGHKKAHLSAYFRPSRSLDVLLLSPTDTGFYTSPNRSGLVDGSESDGSMIIHTDDERRLDSGVSSVTGIRIRGNKAFGGRANRLVPVSSDDDDLIYLPSMPTTSSTLPRSTRKRARGGRKYIVTSLTKSQSNPSIYQNISNNSSTAQKVKNSVSQGEIDKIADHGQDESTNRSHLYIKNSCKPSHSYTVTAVTETTHQDVPTDSERDLSIHKITVDLELDRLQKSGTHLNEIIRIENVYQNELTLLPPRMSSTPLSTLEKTQKRSHEINHGVKVYTSFDGVEIHVSNTEESHPMPKVRQAVSPIIVVNQNRSRKGSTDNLINSARDNRRKSTVTDIDWFAAFNMKEPTTPRSPRSPLPIDALRECERYVLEHGNFSKKLWKYDNSENYRCSRIPLAHIEVDDIFKCVNDGSLNVNVCTCSACTLSKIPDEELRRMLRAKMEATRRNTYIYPEDSEPSRKFLESSIPLSSISVDDVFGHPENSSRKHDLSEIILEREQVKSVIDDDQHSTVICCTASLENKHESPEKKTFEQLHEDTFGNENHLKIHHTEKEPESSELDISLDDVFASTSTGASKKDSIDYDKYLQRGRKLRETSTGGFNTTVVTSGTVTTHRRQSSIPDADVNVDELFDTSKPTPPTRQARPAEVVEVDVEVHQPKEEPKSSELDISLDDVFASTSTGASKKNSIDYDKYLQRGRELRETSTGGFNTSVVTSGTVTTHRRQSSIPDADVSVDELFDTSKPTTPTRQARPAEVVEVDVEVHQPKEEPKSSELDISLDDVFASTSTGTSKKDSIDYDKYLQRGRELRETSTAGFNTSVVTSETVTTHRRQSSMPDADVSVDELFDTSKPTPPTRQARPAEVVEVDVEIHQPKEEPKSSELDISLDDVFASTSTGASKKNSIDYDKYLQRGRELRETSTGGFNTSVVTSETVTTHRRQSSMPDADVSVDELFDTSKPTHPTRQARPAEVVEVDVEIHQPKEEPKSSELDISLDDVFASTSTGASKKNSIDYDKYLQRGRELRETSTGGFNTSVVTSEAVTTHRRQSSIPDADVSVDELFDTSKPTPPTRQARPAEVVEVDVEIHQPKEEPKSSELDISLDDVFASTSTGASKKNSIDYDKYLQRGRELRETSTGGFNTSVVTSETVTTHRRQSSMPDADVSVDELFDTSKPTPPTRQARPAEVVEVDVEVHQPKEEPKSSELDISLDDVFASTSTGASKKNSIDYGKYLQRGRELRETSTGGFHTSVVTSEAVTTHRRQSSMPDADVSVDELFDTSKPTHPTRQARPAEVVEVDVEIHQPKEEPKSSELDISLDDVFASTSTGASKKNSIDYDKYLQRGRELRETSTGGFNTSVVTSEAVTTHRRQSSIPDADVSVDELFDTSKPTPPTRQARPAEVVEVDVEIHQPKEEPKSSELDISLDDVFASTSTGASKKNSIDYDKYLQRGRELRETSTGGFNTSVVTSEAVTTHRRQSSIPDADVSVDELFDTSKPTPPTRQARPAEVVEVDVEIHQPKEEPKSSELDISLDDVFASTSTGASKKNSIDYDKYLQRGRELRETSTGGFNTSVVTSETVTTHRRQSSMPDADVSVDELFDTSKPTPPTRQARPAEVVEVDVEVHRPKEEPKSSELDISLDDVFASTSTGASKKNSIDYDKYLQRGRELRETSTGGFNTSVVTSEAVTTHRRQSSMPDADVSVDELFDTSKPTPPTRQARPAEVVEVDVEIHQPKEEPKSSELDISLDDVFASTSTGASKKNSIDYDKYLQRGRELRETSTGGFNTSVVTSEAVTTHRRQSSIPDADVSVDELFDTSKPTPPTRQARPAEVVEVDVEVHQPKEEPKSSELDISLDDVFASTSTGASKKNSIDYDKYLQRGRELRETSTGGFNTSVVTSEAVTTHRRQSSIPDADVSVDELFDTSKPTPPTRQARPAEVVEVDVEIHQPKEEPKSSELDISLDDVFASTSTGASKKNSIDYDKYLQRGRELRETSTGGFNTSVVTSEAVTTHRRQSSIPDADVSVDELFDTSKPTPSTRQARPAEVVEVDVEIHQPKEEPKSSELDISLDDVFASTSTGASKKNSIDYDKYLQRGRELRETSTVGFNTSVVTSETVTTHRRQSSMPDADVSVDELFDTSKPTPPTRQARPAEVVEVDVEVHQPKEEPKSSELDISLDDVFASTSTGASKKNSIDYDKYLQRGRELRETSTGGFNTSVVTSEAVTTHRRQSSIPDADVSVDELFDTSKPTPPTRQARPAEVVEVDVEVHQPKEEPKSSELDISLDDVFASTSTGASKKNSIDYDKYLQRGRELRETSTGGFNTSVVTSGTVTTHRRQSSIPDADVSVDELFDTSKPTTPTRQARPAEVVEVDVEVHQPKEEPKSSELDISLDDVFASTSTGTSKKDSIDYDKYLQRGRELRETSMAGFNTSVVTSETVTTHRRQSSMPDADVSVDELFDTSKPTPPTRQARPAEVVEVDVEVHQLKEEPKSSELDISLDDVFASTSTGTSKKDSIDYDKYLQRGRELRETSTGGFNTSVVTSEAVTTHRRQSSIPDADVSVDELFDTSKPAPPTRQARPAEVVEVDVEIHQPKEEPKSSELDISLDDVFASTSTGTSKKNSINYDKYLQRGRELRETSTGGFNTSVVPSETVTTHRRQSSIPDADVSVDELFDTSKPTTPTRQARPAEVVEVDVEVHQPKEEPKSSELDISLDDVFASTSTGTSKKDSIDYDKYLQRGRELRETSTGGFNTSVVTSEAVTTHRRQSSIPDADVSVDELFDTSKPTPPTRQARPAEVVEVDVEVHQPKEEPKSSELDISLDDVFASTSTGTSKKDSIDYDKYLQRGRELRETSTAGFNTSVVTSEAVTTHRRQSSIPDADVSVDELFDTSKPTPPVRSARSDRVKAEKVDRDESEASVVDGKSEEVLVDSEPYIPTNVPLPQKDIDAPAGGLKRKMGWMTPEKSIGVVCSQRRGSLPTPPNSLCDSSEELFLDSTVSPDRRRSYDSHDNGEVSDNRTRSKSVTSMNGKKVFTVTFPEQSELMEETEKTKEPERPSATRKIRKPTPNMQRTSVFDIFNINSGEDSEDGKDEEDCNNSVSSGSGVLRRDRCLDETSSVSSSVKQFSGKLPIITRIHSTSLAVSLDDLGKTESEDAHIIPSEPYEVLEGFPTVVPSRRASRFSIRTDELDESYQSQDFSRAKTRALTSTFSEYYDDLKSPPHTPIKLRRRSISFYYEEPVEMPVEEEVDVQDFVDEILNQSLDEAAFLATSKHMSFKKEVPRSTDTSIDRKQSETDSPILSDMTTSSIIRTSEQMADRVFVSSTNRNSLYEAILTCPGTDNGPMSPTLLPKKEEKTDNINVNINLDKKTFISEATMVMKENQSEDYLVRLIFPEKPVETIIVQENYEESDNQSRNTTNVTSKIKHIVEKMPPQQKDDEYLEVEVNSEYFIIHGKYSMIIHKTEPLGEMLSKIQTNSLDFTVTPKIRKILRQCLHNKISGNNGTDISSRAFHMMNRADPAYDNLNQMSLNRFAHNNRNGNINFCTAENMVCRPLIQNRIRENLNIVEDHLFHYGPGGGYEDVKETILGYLKKFMKGTHVQKKDLVLVGSGNTCYDLICHCLFESEDVILTNTPSYARLFLDCSERAGCRVEAVPIDLDNLQIDLQSFERVLKEQREQGNSVKGIVLINPNNPLGITFPKSQVLALGDWAANNDLNLIVDESFSNSNYGTDKCESFLSYQHELKNPSKAVWFWSLSKDFGLPGVKIATLHTPNPSLKEGIAALELIYPVSALAQDFASNLLSDYQWAEQFHETKNHRISKHYEFVSANLKALNLNYITATSGFYVLVDFGQKMKSRTFEEEDRVWHSLIANGIFMTRGRDMRCSQAGWMRLVFGCDKDQVEEGIRRLHKMFGSTANVIGSINY